MLEQGTRILLALLVHLEQQLQGHPGLEEQAPHLEEHLSVAHALDLTPGEVDGCT